jgi:hypothetical protein
MLPKLSLRRLFLLLITPGAIAACQVVAGIDERKLDPNASTDLKLCNEYCDAVMDTCKDDFAVYKNREQCMGVCTKLPPGDDQEKIDENSVHCRLNHMDSARLEPEDCRNVGPGGNGVCGTDCEAYCILFKETCPGDFKYDDETCLQNCAGLIDQPGRYNLEKDHDGDTIECRLVHTTSATVEPLTHCAHATIVPAKPYCIDDAKGPATCEEYCHIAMAACQGDLQQYDDETQCLAACKALPLGLNGDTTENTVGCRRYHSFNSTLTPSGHCFHAGPTGDGHCGGATGNCESYCALAMAACPDGFATTFASVDECMTSCSALPDSKTDSKFTLASAAEGKGYQCRVLHALKAFATPTLHCDSALGGGDCEE